MKTFLEYWNIVSDDIKKDAKPSSDRAVFTFGRLNPPTIGHSVLIEETQKAAIKDGADYYIFVSQSGPSHKTPKKDGDGFITDPLEYDSKVRYLEKMFPSVSFMDVEMAKSPFLAGYWLRDNGYKHVKLVAGSDRAAGYEASFKPYLNKPEDPKNSFDFESFSVVPLTRDPDAEGAASASASLAREHVKQYYAANVAGDEELRATALANFYSIIPGLSDADKDALMEEIENGMSAKLTDKESVYKQYYQTKMSN